VKSGDRVVDISRRLKDLLLNAEHLCDALEASAEDLHFQTDLAFSPGTYNARRCKLGVSEAIEALEGMAADVAIAEGRGPTP
jgi:hypothetical protein